MPTFETEAQKTSSEKVILCHIEPSQRLVLWELHSGAVYKRAVDYFGVGMAVDGVDMIQGSSVALNAGEWFFDYSTKTFYVRMADDSNPQASFMVGTYRLFFSNSGHTLSWDLSNQGDQVNYEPIINSTSRFNQEIDNAELLGISIESEGDISFKNDSGYFDPIFDRLIWEFKNIRIYSWFPNTVFSEARLTFEGVIEDKAFTEKSVRFRVKDFIYKLRQPVALELFQNSDGVISEDVAGVRFKRRIYGQVNGLKMQSLNQTLKGYPLTGTITGASESTTITGVGTLFLDELSPDDDIIVVQGFDEFEYKVESITDNTTVIISSEIENAFAGISAIVSPDRPWRKRNRLFHVAGHKLREPVSTITRVLQKNRFEMDVNDFKANDLITVDGEFARIKRISGIQVVLFQNLDDFPSIGDVVTRSPIDSVFFNKKELQVVRDYTVDNTATECKLTLSELAEFNTTPQQIVLGSATFTNGSLDVTGVGTNFPDEIRPRDWIKSDDIFHQVFYEVREVVDETNLKLRIVYAGPNYTGGAKRKNVKYIDDESPVTVNAIGKEDADGKWIKTASDAVLDLVKTDAGITNIDLASFAEADDQADYTLSLKLPLETDGEPPIIRDAITLINQSVFGSLIAKTDFSIAYNVLTPDRPQDLTEIRDDDLVGPTSSFKVSTKSDIRRKITVRYGHFDADRFTGEPGNNSAEYENEFVDFLVGTKDEKSIDCYLLEQDAAVCMAQRYALIHSLPHSVVSIQAKLNLTLKNLNDKIFISLDRLFDRFGGSKNAKKIGIISRISRGPENTSVSFSDLSNQFNRVGAITPDDADEFTVATDDAKIFNGYIVDNDTELPDNSSDDQWNTNLIG